MKKYNKTESFRKWYNGELDLDQKTEEPIENIPAGTHDEQPPETHVAIPVVHKVEDEEIKISQIAYPFCRSCSASSSAPLWSARFYTCPVSRMNRHPRQTPYTSIM